MAGLHLHEQCLAARLDEVGDVAAAQGVKVQAQGVAASGEAGVDPLLPDPGSPFRRPHRRGVGTSQQRPELAGPLFKDVWGPGPDRQHSWARMRSRYESVCPMLSGRLACVGETSPVLRAPGQQSGHGSTAKS